LAVCGFSIAGSRPVASRTEGDATAKRVVDGVLAAERDGSVANRARRLRSALRSSPQFAPAQWHSGRVNIDGEWVPVDKSIPRLAGDKTLQGYRALRAKTPKTLTGQLALATWCRQHKLYDQQRAHLTAVLEIDPNHAAARKALGFVRIGPFWISQRELEQRRKDAVQAAKDLKRWAPTVKSIRAALTGNNRLRYQQALKRLKAIDDPAAIPAIELALAYDNPQLALIAINYLGEKSSKESTLALARQGMFSPWKTLRKRAAEKLKSRKLEDFVPQVLNVTSTPIASRRLLYLSNNGSLFYRHFYLQENQNIRKVSVADYRHQVLKLVFLAPGTEWADAGTVWNRARIARTNPFLRINAVQAAKELAYRHEASGEQVNELKSELNSRAAELLSSVSGTKFGTNPREYWEWWDRHTEVSNEGEKPYYIEYAKTETSQFVEPVILLKVSCLVAGTPVWTDRGPVAIDKVRIGDRVLSQNVETGELAYKPVMKTTVRPKRPLIALEIGPRTVRMTGGHPFWVPGKGWMKARDIKEGMVMHDVTGTTAVRPVGTAKAEPTYNLIVADFHTYFVGETKVLSHDNTPIEPTNALVPGLVQKR
jgi:hypothetical protein